MNIVESIHKRYSVRTYSDQRIEEHKLKHLKQFMEENMKGPFGNMVRLQIVDASEVSKDELKQLGTYGFIKGGKVFIAGAVRTGAYAMEDFGYCMEKAILEATKLGLGTVWLGGFLSRSAFGQKLNLLEDEVIPGVTPIGYAAENRTMVDKLVRTMSRGSKRKSFEELFFEGSISTPLQSQSCGEYLDVLEAVRWAPSASNKQPWRIIKEEGGNTFHLFLKEDKVYNNSIKGVRMQNVDMGIAMCHFEMAALELGLAGVWKVVNQELSADNRTYIASWIGA